ncbi:MAG: HAD-IB family hydrolase [Candidatus Paceibacterota bacterium]
MKKQKVAIFDIDGTIFRSSLLIELVETLVEDNVFPSDMRGHYERAHKKWLDRKGDYESYIMAVVDAFMDNIKGVPFEDVEVAAKTVAKIHKDRTYKYTRELIQTLKKKGYYLLAISQSPKVILDVFCKPLGFNKIYGRFYELGPTDKFTGEVVDLHLIANKANIVRRAVEKEGLTLKGSVGVGDTEGDIPFLELVDTAICFNPNKLLYKVALRNKWKIVVERKDVIYTL